MKSITPDTTLHELNLERARLGIIHLAIMTHPTQIYLSCYVEGADGVCATGGGEILADALNDALTKFEAKLGAVLAREQTS